MEQFEAWKTDAIELTDGTFEKEGKIWYFDERNLEVFTEVGAHDLTNCTDVMQALDFCKRNGYLPEDDIELMEMEETEPVGVTK